MSVRRLQATAPPDWTDDELTSYLMGALVGLRLAIDHRREALDLVADLERLVAETAATPVELVEVLVRDAASETIGR